MNNKSQIIAAIKVFSMGEGHTQNIYNAIEPYLLKYDREKMRQELIKGNLGYFELEPALTIIEATLGLHTPAPVGGGKNLRCPHCNRTYCTCSERPQEKQCTCPMAAGIKPPHDWKHFPDCPLYSQPVKEKMELPEELNEPTDDDVANRYATGANILELALKINAIIRYLRAQEDNQK